MELKKISKEELKEKLKLHEKWLNGEKEGVKLDLRNTDLRYTDLINANLKYADLTGANLTGANLEGTNLEDAILKKANLTNTILQDTIVPMRNKEDIKEEVKVSETNSMDFNNIFDII